MAQSKNNVITHGMSGMIGDTIVFRNRGGITVVSNAPKHTDRPATPAQKAVQERFQQAVIYGKSVNADPAAKAEYAAQAKPGQSAYNVAVADFFNAPDIVEVDLSGYTGAVNDIIRVKATDDFGVMSVHIKIENGNNTLVEEGDAKADADGLHWTYTATAANATLTGDKITITAKDRPENTAAYSQILP